MQKLTFAGLFLAGLLAAGPADATPVTYSFEGVLTDTTGPVSDLLMPGIGVGTEFTGILDLVPYEEHASFLYATLSVRIGVNQLVSAWTVGADPLAQFATGIMNGLFSSPTVQGGYLDVFHLNLLTGDGSPGAMFLGIENVHDWSSRGSVAGEIRTVHTVPEPATGGLVIFGVVASAAIARRRRRLTSED
jgi:hypothetical protein